MTTEEDGWKVGVLFAHEGVTRLIERSQYRGVLLAINEINEAGGVLGRKLKPVIHDPRSITSEYGRLAQKLILEDRVNVIFGCYTSSARKEVLPIVERHNALFFYSTLYEGFEYSPNVLYGGAIPNQNSVPLARYLLNNYGPRFYFIGSDYIYPRESNRVMRNILREGGGEVVGERYLPLVTDASAIANVLEDVREIQPDVIFSTMVGQGSIDLHRCFAEAGFDSKTMPIGSLTTNEAEIAVMGPEVSAGHIVSAPYFQSVESAANRGFLDRYEKIYGSYQDVTSCAEAAYTQVHLFAQALQTTQKLSTDMLREAILGSVYDAPQGLVRIDPDNGHAYLQSRIAMVNEKGHFRIKCESIRPIKPDPYLVHPQFNDWSLKMREPRTSS
ncbi:two component sensor kinase [Fulvimarina pelagi HTCC2506]|uniref:Two component sensor kinase n=1 Tax=Fulvimarina pelagi HTCC2506 TaxID=314231 RepID=Q0FY90_9HYPH|nr:transporter substrate-binding domain-containing protein [Fulvimarina pelagi]EAU39852.1 two component sensor kinase [Fulvimarina pelagi HTCC2506]